MYENLTGQFISAALPTGKKEEMILIGAGQAQRPALLVQRDPGLASEILTAFAAFGLGVADVSPDLTHNESVEGELSGAIICPIVVDFHIIR